ncbi:MAG: LysR family transcriptional regulator [Desulfobacter sp.]|nr:LysR family transcriptional regulator [Desulfobacter sp.]WDP87932.1 MAG: LysR family transcriptional regulator [Desulfobacter sp.]
MTLRQLELFLALVKAPHLSQVAKDYGLTQSAVSMAIKALEETLGKPLFDRIHKRLVINENGRYFYRMVDPLVFGLRESEMMFRDQDLLGDIKIGASSSIANYILPQIIYEFAEQYGGVRLEKITGNTEEIGRLIEDGDVDIGFVEADYASTEIERKVLGLDELYVVTGDRDLVRDEEYNLDELLSKRWILREEGSGTREVFLHYMEKYKKRFRPFLEVGHTEAVKSVLRNKGAVSCLSRISVMNELSAGQLFRLKIRDFKFTRSFYTIWHKNKYFSSVLQAFLFYTKERYKAVYESQTHIH